MTQKQKKWLVAALSLVLAALLLVAFLLPEPTAPPTTDPTTEPIPETTFEPVPTNPYTPEDFTTEDGKLQLIEGKTEFGIDVSYWQGDIDWQQVAESGVEFAMIRLGWRGSEQGLLAEDDYVRANYEGARAAGIKVGGYFFSQSISPAEAVEEAEYVLDLIDGWEMDMPIVYDWEYISAESRTGHVDARLLTDCTKAFCERIRQGGYEPMIYFNADQSHKQMFLEELTQYPFWLAMYESEMDYPYKIDMWQYSCTGTVPGIEGNVDLNLYFHYE